MLDICKNCLNEQNAFNSDRQSYETGSSKLFHQEFVEFAVRLKCISNWFIDYRNRTNPSDDHIHEISCRIGTHLDETAYDIAELVSIEFLQNIYYNDYEADN